jgi:hypothetical protein
MLVPTFTVAYNTGDIDKAMMFKDWSDPWFVTQFALSCIFGFILVSLFW